jgi:hypothetical protein
MNEWISTSPQWRRIQAFCEIGGTHDPWEATVRIAETVRSKSNQIAPPFDARRFCLSYGVSVEDQWLIDCDARLLPVPNGFVAEVQADHSATRKQFSICHELAHVFFNCEDSSSGEISCDSNSSEAILEERLCDRVAVELLMPQEMFCAHASKLSAEFASVASLAETFRVSIQAAMKRVVELNVWPCGIVNYKTTQCGALNLLYWRVSDVWRDTSKSYYSANLLGNAIRGASRGLRRLVLPLATRSVQVEWYMYGGGSKSPSICAFLSAGPEKP